MDVSGDPRRGHLPPLLALLAPLRGQRGEEEEKEKEQESVCASGSRPLRLSLHAGEVPGEEEFALALSCGAERLGHCHALSESSAAALAACRRPIETCPSSSCATLQLQHAGQHPFLATWLQSCHPLAVSSDDSGVFSTSLSTEYGLVAQAAGLGRQELAQLTLSAFHLAFCSEEEKAALLQQAQALTAAAAAADE